ncbi:unnamed protein product [Lepeophtheirus salmonis]|uniref:(salmon louse) hypothetical protein n=1 Tax=Lepeophtheirus salmonis TaxID=72036 RepID=A0A7R8DBC9_LEPSM|nr:unnamed protein product [Lepeophtheirus salmonis]CAF3034312.1 unnamed protein product [Lepeophtheirus salmonis]
MGGSSIFTHRGGAWEEIEPSRRVRIGRVNRNSAGVRLPLSGVDRYEKNSSCKLLTRLWTHPQTLQHSWLDVVRRRHHTPSKCPTHENLWPLRGYTSPYQLPPRWEDAHQMANEENASACEISNPVKSLILKLNIDNIIVKRASLPVTTCGSFFVILMVYSKGLWSVLMVKDISLTLKVNVTGRSLSWPYWDSTTPSPAVMHPDFLMEIKLCSTKEDHINSTLFLVLKIDLSRSGYKIELDPKRSDFYSRGLDG